MDNPTPTPEELQRAISQHGEVYARALAQTFGELEARVRDLSAVCRIVDALKTPQDTRLVLERILDVLVEETSAEGASLMLLDRETGSLIVKATRGEGFPAGGYYRIFTRGRPSLSAAEWVALRVARQAETVFIPDISRDRQFFEGAGVQKLAGTLLCLPLKVGEEMLGVLSLSHPRPDAFHPDDVRLMRLVKDQVAIAFNATRFFEDILEPIHAVRLEAREEADETRARLQQQARLAAVGQMAAGIAHDFNNMLTSTIGFAQILSESEDVPGWAKDRLKLIVLSGERAAQLVRQILDFSRRSVAQQERMDLVAFMEEMIELLRRMLPENIQMVFDSRSARCWVEGNSTQLQQVITNLAVNARDAMPRGGRLHVGLSSLVVRPGEVAPLPEMAPGNWVMWTVGDSGTGMSEAVRARIFEPFFTTKGPEQGTGLGLAQVYGIVKQHGGYIDVRSREGRGTRFTVYLPQAGGVSAAEQDEEQATFRGKGETILVVEDQQDVRRAVQSMLERLNYRVRAAANGQEALAIYEAQGGQIDLVLTDLVMPGMSGTELEEALRARNPRVRVVVMTGYPLAAEEESQQLRSLRGGWLEKPLMMAVLARAMREGLDQEA